MNTSTDNQDLPNWMAESDSKWVVSYKGNCCTTWLRSVKVNPKHDYTSTVIAIRDHLLRTKDHPGWTGVEYCPGYSKDGVAVFSTTYDSGD
jgi:hypothetical protein